MRRWQLFEFVDQPWLPASLRALITDYTRALGALTQPFSPGLPMLLEALRAAPERRVVDLCAGTGGPWAELSPQLNRLVRQRVPVLLTDRHPPPALSPLAADVQLHPEPVDARAVPAELTGLRSLFDGLHHFPPDEARAILAAAVRDGQPIVVFEMLRRSWPDLLLVALTPLLVLLLALRWPWSARRLLLTWVMPVAPLLVTWDSLVSMLRCYRPDELLAMTEGLGEHWEWAAGSYRHRAVPVTWLIGYPRPA